MPTWRNGRRAAFRSQSVYAGEGSSPFVGTNSFLFITYFPETVSTDPSKDSTQSSPNPRPSSRSPPSDASGSARYPCSDTPQLPSPASSCCTRGDATSPSGQGALAESGSISAPSPAPSALFRNGSTLPTPVQSRASPHPSECSGAPCSIHSPCTRPPAQGTSPDSPRSCSLARKFPSASFISHRASINAFSQCADSWHSVETFAFPFTSSITA